MLEERYIDHRRTYVLKPAQRLGRAFRILGRFFSWRNLAHAFRTVTRAWREYLPFYIACFAVQLIFWTGFIYSDTLLATARAEAYAAADCHIVIDGLTDDEKTAIENGKLWVDQHLEPKDRLYREFRFVGYTDGMGDERYEMRIVLNGDSSASADDLISYYSIGGAESHTYYTERITLIEDANAEVRVVRLVFFGLSLIFAAAALMILFNIRTNHYKFLYGVYMSFGAGFEKLFETASWELFMVSALTFLPSMSAGTVIAALIYLPRGAVFGWRLTNIPWALLWDLLTVFIAVFPPVLALSKRRPVQLLKAGDNSDLVSSPRRSVYIFGKRFPEAYELYSAMRFRRYMAGLLVGAVSFSAVFLCGIFLTERQSDIMKAPAPQLGITLPGGVGDADVMLAGDIDGVDYIMWESSADAAGWRSHAVLSAAQAGSRNYVSVKSQDGKGIATNSFKYSAADGRILDTVEAHGLWSVEGDLRSVLDDKYTVAVSNYIYNTRELSIRPGDKIKLARLVYAPPDSMLSDPQLILQQQISHGEFSYIEVTVGAVVDTKEADGSFVIMVNPELYADITGDAPKINFAGVYLENGMTHDRVQNVFSELRRLLSTDSGYMIYDYQTDVFFAKETKTDVCGVMLVCSLAALMLSPVVWFFSQSVFFAKREGEFYMLGAFGATDADIKKLHLFSGGMAAAAAFAASILLGSTAGYIMFRAMDNWLPGLGFIKAERYSFSIPIAASAACLAVSAACGFASSLLPFRSYVKKREQKERARLGQGG